MATKKSKKAELEEEFNNYLIEHHMEDFVDKASPKNLKKFKSFHPKTRGVYLDVTDRYMRLFSYYEHNPSNRLNLFMDKLTTSEIILDLQKRVPDDMDCITLCKDKKLKKLILLLYLYNIPVTCYHFYHNIPYQDVLDYIDFLEKTGERCKHATQEVASNYFYRHIASYNPNQSKGLPFEQQLELDGKDVEKIIHSYFYMNYESKFFSEDGWQKLLDVCNTDFSSMMVIISEISNRELSVFYKDELNDLAVLLARAFNNPDETGTIRYNIDSIIELCELYLFHCNADCDFLQLYPISAMRRNRLEVGSRNPTTKGLLYSYFLSGVQLNLVSTELDDVMEIIQDLTTDIKHFTKNLTVVSERWFQQGVIALYEMYQHDFVQIVDKLLHMPPNFLMDMLLYAPKGHSLAVYLDLNLEPEELMDMVKNSPQIHTFEPNTLTYWYNKLNTL